MQIIFQKRNKIANKAYAALVTTAKLNNETIARLENAFVYFTSHQKKWMVSGLLLLPFKTK